MINRLGRLYIITLPFPWLYWKCVTQKAKNEIQTSTKIGKGNGSDGGISWKIQEPSWYGVKNCWAGLYIFGFENFGLEKGRKEKKKIEQVRN